jgi:hypothetical protein
MIEASCHCGAVRIEIDAPAPDELNDCACSICRRKGALWAYFSPKVVRVSGDTAVYMWGDHELENHSCKVCACTTHWTPVDRSYDRMGVNARMMDPAIFEAAKIRKSPGPA